MNIKVEIYKALAEYLPHVVSQLNFYFSVNKFTLQKYRLLSLPSHWYDNGLHDYVDFSYQSNNCLHLILNVSSEALR